MQGSGQPLLGGCSEGNGDGLLRKVPAKPSSQPRACFFLSAVVPAKAPQPIHGPPTPDSPASNIHRLPNSASGVTAQGQRLVRQTMLRPTRLRAAHCPHLRPRASHRLSETGTLRLLSATTESRSSQNKGASHYCQEGNPRNGLSFDALWQFKRATAQNCQPWPRAAAS